MDYSWGNPYGLAVQGLPTYGLMSPFNSWGLGAMGQDVDPMEATRPKFTTRTGDAEGGETRGYSAPGDPNAATQTSQATKDRTASAVRGALGDTLGKTALGIGGALSAGMPAGMIGQAALSGITSPSSIGGVLGAGINGMLGTTPQGFLGKTLSSIPGIGLGLVGGPIGGLLGGMIGGPIADGVMDAMDMRSREETRDDYEDQAGYGAGRRAYADRLGIEQAAAAVRDAIPSSMASIHAMDKAIAATRALENSYGITPSYGMEPGGFSAGKSYGGWASPGGPSVNGARAVDAGYGPNMGGYAGLGMGNPSSYGGGSNSGGGSSGKANGGGYGGHAGDQDGSSTGFGR